MGCSSPCSFLSPDPDIKKIIDEVNEKCDELEEVFKKKRDELKKAQEESFSDRHKELKELKDKNEEITEKTLIDLNKKEVDVEVKALTQKVNEIHCLFEKGLEFAEPLKKVSIDKLLEKAKSAPAIGVKKINAEIEEIKKMPDVEFLNSKFGKPLKTALAKKGMSKTFLTDFKKNLLKERSDRRKKEREEFGIKKNEFDDDENIDIDLYSLIEKEINGDDDDDEDEDKRGKDEDFEEYIKKKINGMLKYSKK